MIYRLFAGVSAWLSKWTPPVVAAAAVAAYFEPGLFGWVRGDAQNAVLGVIMLSMGMTLKGEDFKALASRPLDLAIGAVAQYTLMPLIAWTLDSLRLADGADAQTYFARLRARLAGLWRAAGE